MSSSARKRKNQFRLVLYVDQNPVRLNVQFPEFLQFAFQLVVAVFFGELLAAFQPFQNFCKSIHVKMSLFRKTNIFLNDDV